MHPRKITIKALEKMDMSSNGMVQTTTCTTIHKQERQSQSSGTTSMKMI